MRPIELRYYLVAVALPLDHRVLRSRRSSEAATAYRRIEGFVRRADRGASADVDAGGVLCAEFAEAMDDDLAVPAALAALHDVVREGNKLLADGDRPTRCAAAWPSVRAMLDVLGLDPLDADLGGAGGGRPTCTASVDALVAVAARAARRGAGAQGLRRRRRDPRPARPPPASSSRTPRTAHAGRLRRGS